MTSQRVSFTLNTRSVEIDVDRDQSFLDVLRDELGLNGAKYGCGMAQCGSCTVLVDGLPARSCVLRAARVAGTSVTTLEGLAVDGVLHPVQRAFIEKQGAQCGYCLNGMIMSAVALLSREPAPDRARIREALRDNLCRCGTHQEIVEAVEHAAMLMSAAEDRA